MPAPYLALFALPPLIALAFCLLLTGLRPRRTGQTRYCRKCRYNLTALASDRCPECGADLLAPQATLLGDRIIRRGRVIAGAALALLAAAIGTTLAVGYARGIDWYTFLPTAWVLSDLPSPRPPVAARALQELHRRLNNGELSPDQISQLAEFCLAQQAVADFSSLFRVDVEQSLAALYRKDQFTAAQRTRFLEQIAILEFRARPRILLGELCPTRFELTGYGLDCGFSVCADLKRLEVDGVERSVSQSHWATGKSWSQSSTFSAVEIATAGEHEIRYDFHVATYAGDAAENARSSDTTKLPAQPLAERTIVLSQRVQVFKEEPPDMFRLASSPAIDAAVKAAIEVEVEIDPQGKTRARMSRKTPTPLPLAFDVFFEYDGQREYRSCSIIFPNPPGQAKWGDGYTLYPQSQSRRSTPSTITVILKSSRKAAETTTDIFEIWDGELRFENLPILPAAPPPTTAPARPRPGENK